MTSSFDLKIDASRNKSNWKMSIHEFLCSKGEINELNISFPIQEQKQNLEEQAITLECFFDQFIEQIKNIVEFPMLETVIIAQSVSPINIIVAQQLIEIKDKLRSSAPKFIKIKVFHKSLTNDDEADTFLMTVNQGNKEQAGPVGFRPHFEICGGTFPSQSRSTLSKSSFRTSTKTKISKKKPAAKKRKYDSDDESWHEDESERPVDPAAESEYETDSELPQQSSKRTSPRRNSPQKYQFHQLQDKKGQAIGQPSKRTSPRRSSPRKKYLHQPQGTHEQTVEQTNKRTLSQQRSPRKNHIHQPQTKSKQKVGRPRKRTSPRSKQNDYRAQEEKICNSKAAESVEYAKRNSNDALLDDFSETDEIIQSIEIDPKVYNNPNKGQDQSTAVAESKKLDAVDSEMSDAVDLNENDGLHDRQPPTKKQKISRDKSLDKIAEDLGPYWDVANQREKRASVGLANVPAVIVATHSDTMQKPADTQGSVGLIQDDDDGSGDCFSTNCPPPRPPHKGIKNFLCRHPGQIPYWKYLGGTRTRGANFCWPRNAKQLGYRDKIGRVYYDSFSFNGEIFKVGDFVIMTEEKHKSLCRIISAFQATTSYMGYWSKEEIRIKEELQKRGHVYVEVVEVRKQQYKKEKKGESPHEVFLLDSTQEVSYCGAKVNVSIPTWICGLERLEKVNVMVGESHKLSGSLFCYRTWNKNKLSDYQMNSLSVSAEELVRKYVMKSWHPWHQCEQVQMVNHQHEERFGKFCKKPIGIRPIQSTVVQLQMQEDSSDDSDQFDAESKDVLAWNNNQVTIKPRNKKTAAHIVSLNGDEISYTMDKPLPQLFFHGYCSKYNMIVVDQDKKRELQLLQQAQGLIQRVQDLDKTEYSRMLFQQVERSKQKYINIDDYVAIFHGSVTHTSPEMEYKRELLGFPSFRGQQGAVCTEIHKGQSNVYYVAPCGFGKSLCFILPAMSCKTNGITVVVEPLRALIARQLHSLKGNKHVQVEQLLTHKDSIKVRKPAAVNRLTELANLEALDKPKIIFSSPELLANNGALNVLHRLSQQQKLHRIVIDEFDVVDESGHREVYNDLVPKLRYHCKTMEKPIPFVFLSTTVSTSAIVQTLDFATESKPILFLSERALPDWHSYSVERKHSDDQMVQRIIFLLDDYKKKTKANKRPKAVCYCLTQEYCNSLSKLLNEKGISTAIFTGKTNKDDEIAEIVNKFADGTFQVICATKALGQDFHENDVRFVFHTIMPLSLIDYVQETGRAGRDFQRVFCTLFFSHSDRSKAESVLHLTGPRHLQPQGDSRIQAEANLEHVIEYCVSGEKCRYSMLAEVAVIPAAAPSSQICMNNGAICDNCKAKKESSEVTNCTMLIEECLAKINIACESKRHVTKTSTIEQLIRNSLSSSANDKKKLTNNLVDSLSYSGKSSKSIVTELVHFLRKTGVPGNNNNYNVDWEKFDHLFEDVTKQKIKCYLRYTKLPQGSRLSRPSLVMDLEEVPLCDTEEEISSVSAIVPIVSDDVTSQNYPGGTPTIWVPWIPTLPYLLQFELIRMLTSTAYSQILCRKADRLMAEFATISVYESCKKLHLLLGTTNTMQSYAAVVQQAEKVGLPVDEKAGSEAFRHGSALYYHAKLDNHGKLFLLAPDRGHDCRIFRRFGSHRFLHVNIPKDVPPAIRKSFLQPTWRCGRYWSYLWCKMTKTPQCYVMFAERGVGITPKDEMSSRDVMKWCVSQRLNPDITLGKLPKRLKLSFSKTTPTGVLPSHSVQVVPEFEMKKVHELDGCGLISRSALDFIWVHYKDRYVEAGGNLIESEIEATACPYTGFEGQLGGFKGTWILDEALGDGIMVHCRRSQHKCNLPQKCLLQEPFSNTASDYDPCYDTIEICSWDAKPEPATLNTRLIQMLEFAGAQWDLLRKCADDAAQLLSDLAENDNFLVKHLKDRHGTMAEKHYKEQFMEEMEKTDSNIVFQMSVAGINKDEPVFAARRTRLLRKEFISLRKKGHYPIRNCCYLRMYADHTLLLEEGEAFIASNVECDGTEILAMRSPSYFAGDLRKLKIVDIGTLVDRANKNQETISIIPKELQRTADEKCNFFQNIKNALVLSIKGSRAEADKMNGGDHDGDKAWVCWNPELVDSVSTVEAEDTSNYFVPKPMKEMESAWDASLETRLDYACHFRLHHTFLGKYSDLLDKSVDRMGFGHAITRELGRLCFLQADEPYLRVYMRSDMSDKILMLDKCRRWPHWKEKGKEHEYKSKMFLGKLWDFMEDILAAVLAKPSSPKPDKAIIDFVAKTVESGVVTTDFIAEIKEDMNRRINDFLEKIKQQPIGNNWKKVNSWFKTYCEEQREQILEKLKSNEQRQIGFAILYQIASQFIGSKDRIKQIAMDFVWVTGHEYLISIKTLMTNDGTPPLLVPKEMSGTTEVESDDDNNK